MIEEKQRPLSAEEYNNALSHKMKEGFRQLNRFVMDDTFLRCHSDPELMDAISRSIGHQRVYYSDELLPFKSDGVGFTNVCVTPYRSFEMLDHIDSNPATTAVLNFANNHSVGGAPWSAGAQEESLCRCSTLYPCLKAAEPAYHELHRRQYESAEIDDWGNDDIIFTPDVLVIKTDESMPRLLDEYHSTNVITCAAPQLSPYEHLDQDKYIRVMSRRIERILQVAKLNGIETIVLGAFGCGAFCNPPELVAKIFKEQLEAYSFEKACFAIYSREERPDNNLHTFERVFGVKTTDSD